MLVRVVCHLDGSFCGNPPNLDALLEWVVAGRPGIRRDATRPAGAVLDLGGLIEQVGWGPILKLPLATDPVFPRQPRYGTIRISRRLDTSRTWLWDEPERTIVYTNSHWSKSYFLPLKRTYIDRIGYLARTRCPDELRRALRTVRAVGKKTAIGEGRVVDWIVEPVEDPYVRPEEPVWFYPVAEGEYLLMRKLPRHAPDGQEWLPARLHGAKSQYASCCPPYWHPDRFMEIVAPC